MSSNRGKKPITRPRPTPPEVDRTVTEGAQESGGRWEERGRWNRGKDHLAPLAGAGKRRLPTGRNRPPIRSGALSQRCSAKFTAPLLEGWRRGNPAVRPAQGGGRPEPPPPQACEPARVCSYRNCLSSKQPTSCRRPKSARQSQHASPSTPVPARRARPAGTAAGGSAGQVSSPCLKSCSVRGWCRASPLRGFRRCRYQTTPA